jgi:putative hydrolase of the HAD superfamily
MNTKCIIFDADGVVINSEMFSAQYQKQFGLSSEKMLPFFRGIFRDCIIGKADLKVVIQPYLKEWEWNGTVDEFLQFWFKAEHHIDQKIIELITILRNKNLKCYLATNQEKYRIEYMKNDMGFNDIFDYIFSSTEIGYKKPEQEFYEFIFSWINKMDGISKEEIFYVDDSQEAVNAANEFGINSHLYINYDDFIKQINQSIE